MQKLKGRSNRALSAAGVTFEAAVLEYLEALAKQEERSRSWLINHIVKEHAQKNGLSLRNQKFGNHSA